MKWAFKEVLGFQNNAFVVKLMDVEIEEVLVGQKSKSPFERERQWL